MCARSRTFPRLRRLALAQTCTAVACFSLAVLGNVSVVLARPEKRLWARNNNTRVFIYYRKEAVVRVGVAHARIEAKVVGSVRTARCVVCACHRVDASRFTAAGTGSPRRARPSPGGSTPHEASEQQRLRRDPDSRVRLDLEWSAARRGGLISAGKHFVTQPPTRYMPRVHPTARDDAVSWLPGAGGSFGPQPPA
jgi:hypothetical protein